MNDSFSHFLSRLVWADSHRYFPYRSVLRTLGFAGELDTDLFIRRSFWLPGTTPIEGAIVRTFTNDNMENRNFLVYRLPVLAKPLHELVRVDMLSASPLSWWTVPNLLKAVPFISLLLYNLLVLFAPSFIRTILVVLNMVAFLIVGFFYARMFRRFLTGMVRNKRDWIAGMEVVYTDPNDLAALSRASIEVLAPLSDLGIARAIFLEKYLYLSQELPEDLEKTPNVTPGRLIDTLAYLHSDTFLHVFSSAHAD